jgi:co-chaperonin GroES (HSP10)
MKTLQGFQKTTMKKLIGPFLSFGIIALFAIPGLAQAQDPGITATQVFGKVTEINSSGGKLVVKTAAGSVVTVNVNEKTTYQRVPPGETSLTKAEPSALTEITVGDGVVARGYVEADRKSVPAQKIFVVSQSEIAKKNAMERAKWSGGVKGVVSAVNPTTKEITVTSRSLMGASQAVTVAVTDKAELKRYPADSLPKYSEAKPSKFEEVKVGDQLNARGEKSADGMHLTAEEIVSGSFKIVGGTITAIDAATGELKINDLTTKKPLTIVIKPDSVIRRFPQGGPMMMGGGGPPGQGPAQGQAQGGGQQAQGQTAQGAGPQGQRPQGAGSGGPQGPRPGGGMTMADMLDRLPTISINDLKVGDTIIMSTTHGSDPERVTAISMVAGVEQLLTMMAMRQQQGGGPARPSGDLNSNFGGMFGGIGLP